MNAIDRIARLEQKVSRLAAEIASFREKFGYPNAETDAVNIRVDGIETPLRVRKCFRKMLIQTFGDLTEYSAMDLLECKNFGVSSLNWVREVMLEHGLYLKGERSGSYDLRGEQVQDVSRALASPNDRPEPTA